MNRLCRYIAMLMGILLVSGCATYGGSLSQALDQVENQQYPLAEQTITDVLPPKGNDELLHYLELGMVKHLQGEYRESNQLLEQAHQLADYLNRASALENIRVVMLSPRQGVYRGTEYERSLISIIKAMNSLLLAQQAPEQQAMHLDNARVEIRRLEIQLDRLEAELGDYKALRDKEQRNFYKLTQIFRRLEGQWQDPESLLYRTDPWGHYLAGVTYEKQGEFDEARIAYQNSLAAFRDGAIEQYQLDSDMALEARLSYLRSAQSAGSDPAELMFESQNLPADRNGFVDTELPDGYGQIVLVQNVGLIPPKGELNLVVYIQDWGRMLVMEPVLVGDLFQRNDQLSWFVTQYGDLGFTDLMLRYANGGIWQMLDGLATTKKVPLAPVWSLVEDTGLYDAMQGGLRATVPYYPSLHWSQPGPSEVVVEQQGSMLQRHSMLTASSPARIALQEQMRTANRDLRLALAREALKAIVSDELSDRLEKSDTALGSILSAVAQVATVTTSQAETRGWLTLPREIRMRRLTLPSGEYQLRLQTDGRSVIESEQLLTVNVTADEITLVTLATPLRRNERELTY